MKNLPGCPAHPVEETTIDEEGLLS